MTAGTKIMYRSRISDAIRGEQARREALQSELATCTTAAQVDAVMGALDACLDRLQALLEGKTSTEILHRVSAARGRICTIPDDRECHLARCTLHEGYEHADTHTDLSDDDWLALPSGGRQRRHHIESEHEYWH